jgi:hypothetical protein
VGVGKGVMVGVGVWAGVILGTGVGVGVRVVVDADACDGVGDTDETPAGTPPATLGDTSGTVKLIFDTRLCP